MQISLKKEEEKEVKEEKSEWLQSLPPYIYFTWNATVLKHSKISSLVDLKTLYSKALVWLKMDNVSPQD